MPSIDVASFSDSCNLWKPGNEATSYAFFKYPFYPLANFVCMLMRKKLRKSCSCMHVASLHVDIFS